MAWLDQDGITHDGDPPTGWQECGGRWYDIDDYRPQSHEQRIAELVAVAC